MQTTTRGDDAWLTTREVSLRLGIQPETVYAYVSRGLITSDRVGRRSRYRLSEIDALAERLHPGQGRTPANAKRVFRLDGDTPRYRETPVLELAERSSYEQVVDLLWGGSNLTGQTWPAPIDRATRVLRAALAALPEDVILSEKLKVAVATLGALDHAGSSFYAPEVMETGKQLLATMVDGLGRIDGQEQPLLSAHSNGDLAASLWPRLTATEGTPGRVALLDAALILSAEHGMAPSTTVARTAASLGATVYGVVASGLGAGTGDVLGSSALVVEDLLRRLHRSPHAMRGISEQARMQRKLAGFGHVAYPSGDVRARYLLTRLARISGDDPRFVEIGKLVGAMSEHGLPPPTLYFALASIAHCYNMAHGSTEAMFFIGRSAGWIAHAIDEYERK
jgi:citrate synthase